MRWSWVVVVTLLAGCDEDGKLARPIVDTDPPAGGGGTCRCDDAGVTFTIQSGCSGDAFADAEQPTFCRSHVEFNEGQDPGTFELTSGATFGFDGCQVTITCS